MFRSMTSFAVTVLLPFSLIAQSSAPKPKPQTPDPKANSQAVAPKEMPPTPGRIKGVVTYYFNANFGNRPDIGSEVWVVPGSVYLSKNTVVFYYSSVNILVVAQVMQDDKGEFDLASANSHKKEFKVLAHTFVDGNGAFDVDNVPPGWCTVLVQSKQTRSVSLLEHSGKMTMSLIEMKSGETHSISEDFGPDGMPGVFAIH